MQNYLKVLVVSHSRATIDALEQVLRKQPDVKSASKLLTNGHVDPLHGVRDTPDVLLLEVSHNWEHELEALNIRPPGQRPMVLAVGGSEDPKLLRRAMQSGVRDLLSVPIDPDEVAAALKRIVDERLETRRGSPRRMTAVMNAKGGSGATLLASNLSHIMAEEYKIRVALVDLDLQLGTSALCLNLNPKTGITEALNAAQDIDVVALNGYMTKHESGLDVLASVQNELIEPVTASAAQLERLLTVVTQSYDHVVVDLPRSIDPLTLSVLARADRILLVVQQQLSHLHDAKRIVTALRAHVDAVDQRLVVALNRFNNKANIGVRDVENALDSTFHVEIPNEFKRVSMAEELGVPLYAHAPSAPITKALRKLARNLSGTEPPRRSLFSRMFSDRHQSL